MGQLAKRVYVVIICSWFIILTLVSIIPTSSNGVNVLPIATISLDQPAQTADVSPGSLGEVEFTGTVTCETMTGTTAIVSLTAEDTWASATVTPSALQFSANDQGPKNFSVTVKAPLGTSSSTVGQVVVTGKVVMYPTTLIGTVSPRDGVVGRIDIAPYYRFSIHTNDSEIKCPQGDKTKCCFSIDNLGNTDDTFEISIANDDQLFNSGLQITVDTPEITINEQVTEKVFISIITSDSVGIYGEYNLQLEVISLGLTQETGVGIKECLNLNLQIVERDNNIDMPIDDKPEQNDVVDIVEPDVKQTDETSDLDSLFTPGFETVSMLICIVMLILIFSRFDKCRKK